MTNPTIARSMSPTLTPSASHHSVEPTPDGVPTDAPLPLRFAQRFALIAFALYHVPLFLNNYPSLGGGGFNDTGLAVQWGRIFTVPSVWLARHLFDLTGPLESATHATMATPAPSSRECCSPSRLG